MKFDDLKTTVNPYPPNVDDLTATYFYVTVTGNLGVIHRVIINDLLGWRRDLVLNYNPHLSHRAGIAKVIGPKTGAAEVKEAFRKKDITCLPPSYDPLGVSRKRKHVGECRKKYLRVHQTEVLRNWERCAGNPIDETLAQLFNELLSNSMERLGLTKNAEEEDT